MSPGEIETLIRIHCDPRAAMGTELARETIILFQDDGIIELGNGMWQLTEKGKAWLRAICATPYPTQIWIDSRGNEV